MEVWGGNRSTWSGFVVPGLDIWVYSQPFEGDEQGGDVYYLSSCASGRITRLLVGDVSGHGSEASALSTKLRDIMRRNVNFINQSRVVNGLNEQFEEASSAGRFATAIVGTYFAPTRSLTVCSAGHPPPLIYRSGSQRWSRLTASGADDPDQTNLPFGIMSGQEFHSTKSELNSGDLVLFYTDSLFEALDPHGEILKAEGIGRICQTISVASPGDFVTTLLERVQELNPQNLNTDDTTVVLIRANSERVKLKDNVLAPFRILRGLFE